MMKSLGLRGRSRKIKLISTSLAVFDLCLLSFPWMILKFSVYRDEDPHIHGIRTKIHVVPNFPQPGIMFQDITTLLLDPKAFKDTVDLFVERYKGKNISVVAGEKEINEILFIFLFPFLSKINGFWL